MDTLEKATPDQLDLCYALVDQGRKFQRAQGFVQWEDGYPSTETIRNDIACGGGHVVKADGAIAGYLCIRFDPDPMYEEIDGEWGLNARYAVVHRMAFDSAFRGIGLADRTFHLIEELCLRSGVPYIRVDTDFPNKRMQHILEKNGFIRRGMVLFDGSGRIAYDKQL